MKRFSKIKDLFGGGKEKVDLYAGKEEDLFANVQRGDVNYIRTVDQELLLNARDTNGSTVLMIAKEKGDLNLCKEILKKCPSLLYDVNNRNRTVLHQGTGNFFNSNKIISIIDFFISAGVHDRETSNEGDIYMKFKRWMNMQDLSGYTALLEAVDHGNLHIVKRLIEVDREYNLGVSKVVGFDGETPLDLAVKKEANEIVKLLTDEGDPYSDYVPYSTAMELLDRARSGDLDYIETVALNVLLNSRDQDGCSVLYMATKCNQLDCCKKILKRCPSLLYHHNKDKRSVLHAAVLGKHYRLIDFFVSAGLEAMKSEDGTENIIPFQKWINLQDCKGETALILVVVEARSYIESNDDMNDIVKGFVEVDRRYKLGLSEIVGRENRTALQWAMYRDNHEAIKALTASGDPSLDSGANARGKDATTDFKKIHSHKTDKFNSSPSALRNLARDKPQEYSRVQLEEFTKKFSQLVGSGGFGDVYKGQFSDGVFIAVKVLKNIEYSDVKKNSEFKEVMKKQFEAEVRTMGRAYHRNLIKLYGYCYEANTKALVYEFMEQSFDRILFDKNIPWEKLHNIAKEIAQGISYLHESCSPQIIHFDLKPSNVLLDSNFSPKIIDFGLAKVNTEGSQFKQTAIKGTPDYIAPEVNQVVPVNLSYKVDVYSFGKILFDILGSKRNHVEKSMFPFQVWEKYKTNQLENFILGCGIKEEDIENAKRLAIIALLCVEHNPRARPMLSHVVMMLEGKIIELGTPLVPFYPGYNICESSSTSDSRDN